MCFNKEASIFSTFLVYSALVYAIANKYYTNKYFLFVILFYLLTSGITQPLEALIHFIYEKEKSNKSPLFINTETLIWFSILLHPLIVMLLFITLKINPSNNKYVIGLNIIFYMYTLFVYKDIRLKIKLDNSNGYNKILWTNIQKNNYLWTVLEILAFWSPIIFSLSKSIHMKILLIAQLIQIVSANILFNDGNHYAGSLWCFFGSLGIWFQIFAKKLLEI